MKRKKYNATPEQKAAAEHRRARLRDLAAAVTKLSPAERDRFAMAHPVVTCEGRILSVFNQCFLAMQFPGVTMVGGFQQWRKQQRHVRKGERALSIWIPKGERQEPAAADIAPDALAVADTAGTDAGRPSGCRFLLGTVFDVMQTDAREGLPENSDDDERQDDEPAPAAAAPALTLDFEIVEGERA